MHHLIFEYKENLPQIRTTWNLPSLHLDIDITFTKWIMLVQKHIWSTFWLLATELSTPAWIWYKPKHSAEDMSEFLTFLADYTDYLNGCVFLFGVAQCYNYLMRM